MNLVLVASAAPDDGCGVVFMVVIAGFIILAAWNSHSRTQARLRVLSRVAGRWNGRVIPGGWFASPRLEVHVEGVEGEITFKDGGGDRSKWTKVHLNWPTSQRLRVTPQGFTTWLRSIFSGADIEVGDWDFDKKFWVESSDPAWARRVLSGPVRRRFQGLRQDYAVFVSKDVSLDLGPAGMTLKVTRLFLDDWENLEWFVEMAVVILREARAQCDVAGVVVAGLVFTPGSTCPVCGHGVTDGRLCPQCRTPHHDDCWKYSGGCAIFACAGRPGNPRAA